jgi:hypothetical protein
MANPQRGEVPLMVGDRAFTLVLDFDALCHLEDVLSANGQVVTAQEAIYHAMRSSLKYTRALLWAGLRRHHRDVSLIDAGELISDLGGVEKFYEVILALNQSTKPDQEDVSGRPRAARQGSTGGPTTSTGGGSGSRKTRSGG